MSEKNGIWNKAVRLFKQVMYVDYEEEEEQPQPVKEEVKAPEVAEQEEPAVLLQEEAEEEKIIETAAPANINREKAFITLERKPVVATQPEEEKPEEVTEVRKPVTSFREVEIISPLGPSVRRTNNVTASQPKTMNENRTEYKPIVNIISAVGPVAKQQSNDDVDLNVAQMSIDDFTGYVPRNAALPVEEKPIVADEQPQVLVNKPVEDNGFNNIFDQGREVQDIQNNNAANGQFDIPEYLKPEDKQTAKADPEHEDMTLFDFLED